MPRRFVRGHNTPRGAANRAWRGGKRAHGNGYVDVRAPGHPRAHDGYIFEHVAVVEKALGKLLPVGAEVHHVDGRRDNNVGSNLIACEDHAYHMLIEQRARAYAACGNPNAKRCHRCGGYDRQEDMTVPHSGANAYHRDCASRYTTKWKSEKRAKRRAERSS